MHAGAQSGAWLRVSMAVLAVVTGLGLAGAGAAPDASAAARGRAPHGLSAARGRTAPLPVLRRVVLRKRWVNGVRGDTARLTIASPPLPLLPGSRATSTADGRPGVFTDDAHAAVRPVVRGQRVVLSEVLAGRGRYRSLLTCDHGVVPVPATGTSGSVTVSATVLAGATVTCTFTNFARPARLVLRKRWVNGVRGDTARLAIAPLLRLPPARATSTANGQPGVFTDNAHAAVRPVVRGQHLVVSEVLAGRGRYRSLLTCDRGVLRFPVAGTISSVRVPFTLPAGATVTCTFTNFARPGRPSLTIAKRALGRFTAGGHGVYVIRVGNAGPGGTNGTAVTVRDFLPAGLAARSLSGRGWRCSLRRLTCVRRDVLPAGRSYPLITLRVRVSCQARRLVTNIATVRGGGARLRVARASTVIRPGLRCILHRVVLQKRWINGVRGNTARLMISPESRPFFPPARATSTAIGRRGVFTDRMHRAMAKVRTGQRIRLSELLSNRGRYRVKLTCDHGIRPDWGKVSGSFTVPRSLPAGAVITCTFTNKAFIPGAGKTGASPSPSGPAPTGTPGAGAAGLSMLAGVVGLAPRRLRRAFTPPHRGHGG